MKKMNFFVMALLCLCSLAIGFTSCSDDDNSVTPPDLGTPPFEAVSGKYDVTSAGSPYESIELTASGNYIVVLDNGGYSSSVARHASLIDKMTSQTRTAQSGNIIYGTFTDLGNGVYRLEDFGTIELVTGSNGEVTGIEVDSSRYGSTSLAVQKKQNVAGSSMTNALCRTWRVVGGREIDTDLSTGEQEEYSYDPNEPGAMEEMMFNKSGTYVATYNDNTVDMGHWRWKDEGQGIISYVWDAEDWEGYADATISFSGNTATIYERIEEDGYLYEMYTTLETTEIIPDDPTDEPQEPEQPTAESPIARVFGDKLIKTVSDDTYIYENGFLVQIADEDDLEGEGTFFHYNYVTGAEGPDVYTLDGTELEQTATIGENGFVSSVHHEEYDCVTTFEYDAEGRITHIVDGREEREYELTWENGDLVQVTRWHYDEDPIEKSTYLYTYTDQPSNGIMRFYKDYNIDLDVVEQFYYAGLMGIHTRHLIATESSISHDFVIRYEWTDHDLTKYSDSEPDGRVDYTFSFYE